MSTKLEECETLALTLSPSDRATLATHLIASLDALDEAETGRNKRKHQRLGKMPF
jgi:hypothetical protein